MSNCCLLYTSGRVLNVSSLAALVPGPLQAEYYATKAYLTSLSDALWYELRDTGVTLTTLMPVSYTHLQYSKIVFYGPNKLAYH